MELVNVLSQETVRTTKFKKPDVILNLIESEKNPDRKDIDTYIFDDQKRTLIGEYITHTMVKDGEDTVYKLFYKLKQSEVQAVIK